MASAYKGLRRQPVQLAELAHREQGHDDRGAEHGVQHHRQVRAAACPDLNLSNLGFTLNGGEPVDCDGYARFSDEMARFGFNPNSLSPSYGLAESTCAVTIPEPFTGLRVDEVTVTTDAGESTRRFAVLGHPIRRHGGAGEHRAAALHRGDRP